MVINNISNLKLMEKVIFFVCETELMEQAKLVCKVVNLYFMFFSPLRNKILQHMMKDW